MRLRPALPATALFVAVLWSGCAGTSSPVGPPLDAGGERLPPPAEVLDATVVWFDADGRSSAAPEIGAITDQSVLDRFEQDRVDGAPPLGDAAADALAAGNILIGGTVSSGCFPAASGQLVILNGDIRLSPIGLRVEPNVDCVRAITSVALLAIDPSDLPAGALVQGIER